MSTKTPTEEERADEPTAMSLEASDQTREKAHEEPMAFVLPTAGKVNVANYAHGADEAREHIYTVTVDEGDPIACTCPAFEYHCTPGEGCKHMVAVTETEPVLMAALESAAAEETTDEPELRTDGGEPSSARRTSADSHESAGGQVVETDADADERGRPEDCACSGSELGAELGLPCWPCFRDGHDEPNPDAPTGEEEAI